MKNFIKFCFLVLFLLTWYHIYILFDYWNLSWVKIISRVEWDADESIRQLSKPKSEIQAENKRKEEERLAELKKNNYQAYQKEIDAKNKAQKDAEAQAHITSVRNAYMKRFFPNDWTYDASNEKMGNFWLIYPNYYHYNKTKIVIHHTAMDYDTWRNEEEIKQHLQNIYKYHTIDRDFWDIWYNFLIDGLGNIYEWRDGWNWAVWMHVSYNNVATIGISLMGNFEKVQPTQAQIDALIDLVTALSQYYHIDPHATAEYFQPQNEVPYIYSKTLPTIVWHGDIANTACPGKNVKVLLPSIREEVAKRLNQWIISSDDQSLQVSKFYGENLSETQFIKNLKKVVKNNPELIQKVLKEIREDFDKTFHAATNLTAKITHHYTLNEIKHLLKENISVLLYELTTTYNTFYLRCENTCFIERDGEYETTSELKIIIDHWELFYQKKEDKNLIAFNDLSLQSEDQFVTIENYPRKSYIGIPWNLFRGKLRFTKWFYINQQGKQIFAPLVINILSFSDYLKGIVESNDTETLEKNKVMAMLSKSYALFYLKWENHHPSIPENALFNAIDDPNFFQKYVWAWVEKTLTKWYQALEGTQDKIVLYQETLPILPYFSCSAWFTLSALEKFWWTDTPYLTNVIDFWTCKKFSGHWVGLAWQGAEFLAKRWMKYEDILQYFYPGITIETL